MKAVEKGLVLYYQCPNADHIERHEVLRIDKVEDNKITFSCLLFGKDHSLDIKKYINV